MIALVTGANGQLGYDVVRELEARGHQVIPTTSETMDITDAAMVNHVMQEAKPDVVIHCAAYTAVDAAEDDIAQCRKVNADGTRNIALACQSLSCKMLFISTDYVFAGNGTTPWRPEDVKAPINVYGQTKLEAEEAVTSLLSKYFIVRISWVFGVNGKNFVKTMLNLAKNHPDINVVDDQIGSPTYTYDLAKLLADMAESEKYGIYHASNEGFCSWYEFAKQIFETACVDVNVHPVDSSGFPSKAARPMNSRMDKSDLEVNGFDRLPSWQDALKHYIPLICE